MERVARVLLTVDDAKLTEWAEDESRDKVIKDIKEETERGFTDTRQKGVTVEFIEWEPFCPKCERTDVEQLSVEFPAPHGMVVKYKCRDCNHEFTNKDCEV